MALARPAVGSAGVRAEDDAEAIGGDGYGRFEYGLVGDAGGGGVGHREDGEGVFVFLLCVCLGLLLLWGSFDVAGFQLHVMR